ncbi:MAG: pseudaminic acid synthase [Planctomycetota bacterium]
MNAKDTWLADVGSDAAPSAPLIVAEISGNHGGSLESMLQHIDAAAAAGVDAIKIQTYTADTLTIDHAGPGFRIDDPKSLWGGRTLYDLYTEAHTPWAWHAEIFARSRALGLACFSSPFDDTAVAFLEQFEPAAYKIASFELVDHHLLACVARTGRTVILSTGMATAEEIEQALGVLRAANAKRVVLLKCTSAYPAPASDARLATMVELGRRFGTPYGLSDHTPGTTVAVAAVALGACLVEKHFVLDRASGAVDAAFSLEPAEMARLADECRAAHAALGDVSFGAGLAEASSVQFRRSLYAVADIAAGEPFTALNLRSIRPGFGLAPRHLQALLARPARVAYRRGDPITEAELADSGVHA